MRIRDCDSGRHVPQCIFFAVIASSDHHRISDRRITGSWTYESGLSAWGPDQHDCLEKKKRKEKKPGEHKIHDWWDHPGSRPPCGLSGSEPWEVVGKFGPAHMAVWLCKTSARPDLLLSSPLVLYVRCITRELLVLAPGSGRGGRVVGILFIEYHILGASCPLVWLFTTHCLARVALRSASHHRPNDMGRRSDTYMVRTHYL